MARSRTWYLEQIADLMDANNHPRFPSTVLAKYLGVVHFKEWTRLLEENPYLRVQTLDLMRDSNGRIALSSLSTGAMNSQKVFNRVLYVVDGDNREFNEFDFNDAPQAATTGSSRSGRRGWYLDGDCLQVTPVEQRAISIKVNHTPTKANDLAADTDTLEWPDGHELVLVYETAGRALMKGGAETEASGEMKGQAMVDRREMYQQLRRRGTGPRQMKHSDHAVMWGGQ